MLNHIFTVYDTKAKCYLPPFFLPEVGMAVRAFTDLINKEGHQFNAHPEDYTLFQLGDFDDTTSKIDVLQAPDLLYTGLQCIHMEQANEVNDEAPILSSTKS